jgi:hypothetical protein
MSDSPLNNGQDAEASDSGVLALRYQLRAVEIAREQATERQTIQALCEDAKRRYVRARATNDAKAEFDALREMTRYELWLIRRGLV